MGTARIETQWWELRLEVPAPLADDVGAALIDAGAAGIQIRDEATAPPPLSGGPPPPTLPPGVAEIIATYAGDARPSLDDAAEALATFALPAPSADALQQRRDDNWSERWKEFFAPLRMGERLWVIPSWERPDFVPPPDAICLALDPGMAFGTGQHATTALCAELLERACSATPPQALLDVGCGSGILSIAGARLGIARVVGIDIDPDAVTVAEDNARENAVHLELSSTPVADLSESFPWVIANILAPVLINLAAPILARVEAQGTLVLSGLLGSQRSEVLDAYARQAAAGGRSLVVAGELARDEWVALALTVGG